MTEKLDALLITASGLSKTGQAYNSDEFLRRATSEFALHTLPRAREDGAIASLPKAAGIYVLCDLDAQLAYVGLAQNIHHRFTNRTYGHEATRLEACRSHDIVAQRDYRVGVVELIEYDGHAIQQAESDWYAIFAAAGLSMANAQWTLGKKGQDRTPIVSVHLESMRYQAFATIVEAADVLFPNDPRPGLITATLNHYQNQLGGYTHRRLTKEEVAGIDGGRDIVPLIQATPSNAVWRGTGRNSRLTWTSGPLPADDAARLLQNMRGGYQIDLPQSPFIGVYYHSKAGRWQSRAQKSDGASWSTHRKANKTDYDAAVFREETIVAKGWQAWNDSNADNLNEYWGELKFPGW
jgi:hypothetical protein